MNVALIFAGGTGQRMNSTSTPKQFLEVYGKPIVIYTLEKFANHPNIDAIVVVCIESHIDYMLSLMERYCIKKVLAVVPGGDSGQSSIYHGLLAIQEQCAGESIVLIHDGVRPFIDEEVISRNIETAGELGNAITVAPSIETVVIKNEMSQIERVMERQFCYHAKAPQSFKLNDILEVHRQAKAEGKNQFIDSASLMTYYGHKLNVVNGNISNIKITTPQDFYFMRALLEMEENKQLSSL